MYCVYLLDHMLKEDQGAKEVCSLDCYFCQGPLANCSSSITNRPCTPEDVFWSNVPAVCFYVYCTDVDDHVKGCYPRQDCLQVSKHCKEGTHKVPCVAQCCSEDLCNIGFGDTVQV
ncbi:uncharacterized protein [Montipora foliosa]|uniref:uncharacterized protein isoform X1 n=1 Tax=Montipora foliosa TaxID=591990 RepID=UPI0035F1DFC9